MRAHERRHGRGRDAPRAAGRQPPACAACARRRRRASGGAVRRGRQPRDEPPLGASRRGAAGEPAGYRGGARRGRQRPRRPPDAALAGRDRQRRLPTALRRVGRDVHGSLAGGGVAAPRAADLRLRLHVAARGLVGLRRLPRQLPSRRLGARRRHGRALPQPLLGAVRAGDHLLVRRARAVRAGARPDDGRGQHRRPVPPHYRTLQRGDRTGRGTLRRRRQRRVPVARTGRRQRRPAELRPVRPLPPVRDATQREGLVHVHGGGGAGVAVHRRPQPPPRGRLRDGVRARDGVLQGAGRPRRRHRERLNPGDAPTAGDTARLLRALRHVVGEPLQRGCRARAAVRADGLARAVARGAWSRVAGVRTGVDRRRQELRAAPVGHDAETHAPLRRGLPADLRFAHAGGRHHRRRRPLLPRVGDQRPDPGVGPRRQCGAALRSNAVVAHLAAPGDHDRDRRHGVQRAG